LVLTVLFLLLSAPAVAQTFYSVSYNANGGTGYMPDTLIAKDSLYEVLPCSYTREGYEFIGWAIDTATSDSSLIVFYPESQTHIVVSHQFTLYAVWRSNCVDLYDSIITASCGGYVWPPTGDTLFISAIMCDTVFGVVPGGCDSIYYLDLVIHPTYDSLVSVHECDSAFWHGSWYYASTQEVAHYSSIDGCDSSLTMRLMIDYAYHNNTTTSVCDSFYWSATGVWYHHDTTIVLQGYTMSGCDSIIDNCISIHPSFRQDTLAVVCDSFYWVASGEVYYHDTVAFLNFKTPYHCDSVYSLHLDVNRSYAITDTVSGCDSLLWSGPLLSGATTISFFRTTDTAFVQLLSTVDGCDSTVAVSLHVNPSYYQTDVHTVCDSFYWVAGSRSFVSDTDLVVSYHTVADCDSIFSLHLAVGHSLLQHDTVHVCDSFYWAPAHQTYYSAAVDTAAYIGALGCDSTYLLSLELSPGFARFDTVNCCDSYTWPVDGVTYLSDTSLTLSLTTVAGCDSSISLLLDVNASFLVDETISVCDSFYSAYTGLTYYASTVIDIDGQTTSGCDSSVYLDITVNPSFRQEITPVVCDSFYWTANATTYYESQYVHLNSLTTFGCDSSYLLDLTVHHSHVADVFESACDSLFSTTTGRFYFSDTDEDYHTYTTVGCDSLIHLHVTINPTSYLALYDTICDGGSYAFNGQDYQDAGVYYYRARTLAGCDSTIALHLAIWDRPNITFDLDYDCATGYYYIRAHSVAPYFEWSASPSDPSLSGQEHNASVVVKPTRDTRYIIFSDYYAMPTCGNSIELLLSPVVKPTAQIEISPEHLNNDDLRFHAVDRSHNASSRAWYVDGEYVTGESNLWYTASPEADSVLVMLEASTTTCNDTVRHTLYVRRDLLYFPNAFTPDESTNQKFYVSGSGVLNFEIYIYSRGGQLVFHSEDFSVQWDGTGLDGQPCPQGVYVYLVKYRGATMPEMPQVRTGNVLLIR